MTQRALLVVDVQNDFCEGGSLAVTGGAQAAADITDFIHRTGGDYQAVIASRDWHDPDVTNDGHFAPAGAAPDFAATWPVHCVAGTPGADYHDALDVSAIDHHVRKGQGRPAYSMFEGVTDDGTPMPQLLDRLGVSEVDVVGIASDYCVRQTALSAIEQGLQVRVLTDLCAGVAPDTTDAAYAELRGLGADVTTAG